jgi:hypothetical protein
MDQNCDTSFDALASVICSELSLLSSLSLFLLSMILPSPLLLFVLLPSWKIDVGEVDDDEDISRK